MKSIAYVQCPHCGVKGRIFVPAEGMILVGPCPQCQEFVAVFCGKALALDKETMLHASGRERRDHLMEVLTTFLEENIGETLEPAPPEESEPFEEESPPQSENSEYRQQELALSGKPTSQISQAELEHFRTVGLRLLDNKEYFDALFNR